MRYRILLLAAMFAGSLAGAETIAVDNGIAVKESDVATPSRGMTMDQVATKFGTPVTRFPRWASRRFRAGNTRASSCISKRIMSFTAWWQTLKEQNRVRSRPSF